MNLLFLHGFVCIYIWVYNVLKIISEIVYFWSRRELFQQLQIIVFRINLFIYLYIAAFSIAANIQHYLSENWSATLVLGFRMDQILHFPIFFRREVKKRGKPPNIRPSTVLVWIPLPHSYPFTTPSSPHLYLTPATLWQWYCSVLHATTGEVLPTFYKGSYNLFPTEKAV